ncbi:hypothetical protein K457DRAFT_27731, partial [Linnemannia elongata AG-77]
LSTSPTNQAISLNNHQQPSTKHYNNVVRLSLSLSFRLGLSQPRRLALHVSRTQPIRDYNRWRPNHHNRPSRANRQPYNHHGLLHHWGSCYSDHYPSQDNDHCQALVCD